MSSPKEFAECMAVLASATGKTLDAVGTAVYQKLLEDIPIRVLRVAVQRTLLDHKYSTFPPVGTIRDFALRTMGSGPLTTADAWKLAYRASCNIDPAQSGPHWRNGRLFNSQAEAHTEGLPPLVVKAMYAFGLSALCDCDKVEVARAQFGKIFEELRGREEQNENLPPALKEEIRQIRSERVERLQGVVNQIGQIPAESA